MGKEFYKTRLTDFIPIVGMINHIERGSAEEYNYKISDKLVNAGLMMYHFACVPAMIVAESLLESLLKN